MLTDQEFMALMDARVYGQVTGKWGNFGVLGSHAATPSELYSRELYTRLSQAEIDKLSFRWRIMKDKRTSGPTYGDVEFWTSDKHKQRLPQEFFDFVYERAPTLKGKEIDWDYHKYYENPPPGIYFGSGGTHRVPAPWAQPPGQH